MSERARLLSRIEAALAADDFPRSLDALADIEPKKRLKPLFSALLAKESRLRWHAVTALGAAGAELAAREPEAARDFWRSLMWRLNEESGAIGWGIPEVMGEILARAPTLAGDYARILIAYVRDLPGAATAYLDHPLLRRGVWWAIARLAAARPDLARESLDVLPAALAASDPATRGLACLTLARLGPPIAPALAARLADLAGDAATFELYREERVAEVSVAVLAQWALEEGKKAASDGPGHDVPGSLGGETAGN